MTTKVKRMLSIALRLNAHSFYLYAHFLYLLTHTMHKQKKMLETIYETDENIFPREEYDSEKCIEQPSRLPYYICCCMIMGCFLALSLIIAASLNPYLLSKQSTHKNSKSILTIPMHSDDKLTLAVNVINHLDIFAHQIHERLNLQSNTITFFTSTISNSSFDNQNTSDILWIYSHLKYPQSCIDNNNNNQCKEELNFKLKTSFTELSTFLTTIELGSYHDKFIQLDWCSFIENTTNAILVSLVSVTTINQSTAESTILGDRIHCENIDQNILLSKTIDRMIQQDHREVSNLIDFHCNRLESELTSNHPTDCFKYTDYHPPQATIHALNDTDTHVLLTQNSY